MNTTRRIRRLARNLAAGVFALLALAVASPAMAATASVPHYGPPATGTPAQIHTIVAGGMPGWQIALIAAGAAALAALLAVTADRARTARRPGPVPSL
jgi:hypothetical protein